MKRIAIYCVTYNSNESLVRYLKSIDKSLLKAGENVAVDVFVADNSENPQTVDVGSMSFSLCLDAMNGNLGYFGAIRRLMLSHPIDAYDYVVISNVDLTLEKDTLKMLAEYECSDTTGWIAPCIYSSMENRDRNPKIMRRYSLKKLKLLRMFFKYPVLHYLYTKTFYKKKKYVKKPQGKVYAGHGSFIILTAKYFRLAGVIDYPQFLFDEEIYLAEQCLDFKLDVMYVPEIKVMDSEHESTGKMKPKMYYKYNYDSTNYIINTYYAL